MSEWKRSKREREKAQEQRAQAQKMKARILKIEEPPTDPPIKWPKFLQAGIGAKIKFLDTGPLDLGTAWVDEPFGGWQSTVASIIAEERIKAANTTAGTWNYKEVNPVNPHFVPTADQLDEDIVLPAIVTRDYSTCCMCGELLTINDVLPYHTPRGRVLSHNLNPEPVLLGKDCTPSCMYCAKVFGNKIDLEAHEENCSG